MADRLVGLETEYVLRFHPREPGGRRISNETLFHRLLTSLRAKVPVVPAIVGQQCWFLGNGGGLRFECLPFYKIFAAAGFVEGATPECRHPRDFLLYQRAQDVLLSRHAAASGENDGDVVLLKVSHDGRGHLFGSHENYEATIGTGAELLLWRLSLVVLFPLIYLLCAVADTLAILLVGILSVPVLLGSGLLGREPSVHFATFVSWLTCLLRFPAQLVASGLLQYTAFGHLRRQLLPFLITRTIFTGPGMVCPDGRFVLSPRAAALHTECGLTATGWRSVFYFCQIVKIIDKALLGDWPSYAGLFHKRQRLQITLGDSNMAQFAEFLKIGTTLLVLDVIEAGQMPEVPRLRRPLQALRAISAAADVQHRLPLLDGSQASAVQIQRFYLNACRHFLRRRPSSPAWAQQVLSLWEETLEALETEPARLVGKLDWITKLHLLGTVAANASLEERRKLDLRYHELSPAGYYLRLEAAGIAPTLVEPEEVLPAMRLPPPGSPATVRGRLIQQYAESSSEVRASWASVLVPTRWGRRHIRLSRHEDGS